MAEPQQAPAPAADWFAANGIKTLPIDAEALLKEARARADAGDMEGANAAFFKIPAAERQTRGVYAGPGGGDATGKGAMALGAATGIANIRLALTSGATLGGRVLAGAKATLTEAAPVIKYKLAKAGLEAAGVPPEAADGLAMLAAGLPTGKRIPPKAATAGEVIAARPAASGAASAAETVPVAPAPAATVAAPPTSVPAAGGTAADLVQLQGEFHRLVATGKSKEEALALIEQQLKLQQQLGLPSLDAVRRAVADRNTSGRWRE